MKDLFVRIPGIVSEIESELGMDWRTSWHRVRAAGSHRFELEFSRREVMDAAEIRLSKEIPGLSRNPEGSLRIATGTNLDLRLRGEEGGIVLWTVSSVADVRREPEHSSELLSQAIMGEAMRIVDSRGDWYFVRMSDNYHGWVRSWYVAETPAGKVSEYSDAAEWRFEGSVGYVLSERSENSLPVSDVTAGTFLNVEDSEGAYVKVALPGGKKGYLPQDSVCRKVACTTSREGIVARAKRFLGIPYIWGGTSAKGFDCSGLVKRVFLMEGIELPRDADQQSAAGRRIDPEDIGSELPGDLLFFGEGGKITHVAIALGGGSFIHAFGDVRINSYRESDPAFEEKLAGKLMFAKSLI